MKCLQFFARWVFIVSLLSVSFTITASGAVFLKIGDIKGESQAVDHEDEIDVHSWTWGVTRTPDGETGSTRGGTTEFLELEITKVLEKATVKLIEACILGMVFAEATLVVEREKSGEANVKVLEIKMSNVILSSDSLVGSTESIETFSLNFTAVEMIYSTHNPDGSPAGNVEMRYDLETGAP